VVPLAWNRGVFHGTKGPTTVSALQHFRAPEGLAPGPGYSHAVTGRGRWVATAGQVALDDAGQLVGPDDPQAQARQVFANLARALAAAGASFTDVIKLNFYVTDITMLPAVRAIRDEYIDTARPPASTAVQVSALAMPGLMIEIEAWAICEE
jgi:enamine deaminase RidA (YjgF/YER057c/UK114 family)